jgi:hypothetical protein
VFAEGGDHRRVELAPGAPLDGCDGRRWAAQTVEQGRQIGDVREAHRQGDRLPGQPLRPAFAVPALHDLPERLLHTGRQAQAARQRGTDLTVGSLLLPLPTLAE